MSSGDDELSWRFIPNISTILRPVTKLLKKDKEWTWGEPQSQALNKVKEALSSTPTLAFFDLTRKTTVSTDASSYCLGGVLLQDHEWIQKPVAYCSRTLTTTCSILFKDSRRSWTWVHTDWKRVPWSSLGLWKVWEMLGWAIVIQACYRPQAPRSSHQQQGSPWHSTSMPEIVDQVDEIQPRSRFSPRKHI